MTALVSLSAGGAITGFSFVPQAAADISSPTSMPLNLVALKQSAQAAKPAPNSDAMLRTAIVNVADYYLRMAQTKTPAEMEAIIWRHDSIDGADHGQSCAAFASLTLELAAQVVGPAKLGLGRGHLSVAPALLGGRAGRAESRVARHHLDSAGRGGAPSLAPAGGWLPAATGGLGPVRRPRRGDHRGHGRGAAHRGG